MTVVPVSSTAERRYAALAHALPLAALLCLWWWKRKSVFVTAHARAAANFQMSLLLYYGLAVGYAAVHLAFGLLLFLLAATLEAVLVVQAARRAGDGGLYRYRLCLEFIRTRKEGPA